MSTRTRIALAVVGGFISIPAIAQVTFYEANDFEGRSFTTTEGQVSNFARHGFNDRASSVQVIDGRWEACEDARFSGRCVVLRPGWYPSLAAMGLNDRISSVRPVDRNTRIDERRFAPMPVTRYRNDAEVQITFYQAPDFGGQSFSTEKQIGNFARAGFNDRASSVMVLGSRWEVCEDARFRGRCVVLRPGEYPSLAAMGLNNRVSSARTISRDARIADNRYAPMPAPRHDFRRVKNERVYEANVTLVRAVVGPPEQRCWIDQEQVVQERSNNSLPGTIVGAVIGGILGHQVGGGRGQDLATAGGAVAGAVVGGNIGRNSGGGQQVTTQDVQHCADVPSRSGTEYWDVTYFFRGQEHHMQMNTPPGATVTVNEDGEPRV